MPRETHLPTFDEYVTALLEWAEHSDRSRTPGAPVPFAAASVLVLGVGLVLLAVTRGFDRVIVHDAD